MDGEEEGVFVQDNMVGRGTRKRKNNISRLGKEKKTKKSYGAKDINLINFAPPCNHKFDNNIKKFQCIEVPKETLHNVKQLLYTSDDKISQDTRLSTFLRINHPKRSRLSQISDKRKPHDFHITYLVDHENKTYIVCQKFFEKVFEVSKRRILWIARNIRYHKDLKEKRGGKRLPYNKYVEKREKVKAFIGKFKGRESHYNRQKSRRLYLPAVLNILKMWKMYNSSHDLKYHVSYSYFHKIFSCHFNLGFGSPATDVCSFCERTKNRVKIASNRDAKDSVTRELNVHRMRARQFHLVMKEDVDNCETFCFDLEQVQTLPKLPIQEAFYSLQIAFYAFCVVDIKAKRPIFYTWNEVQSGCGSNEIGSAVFHFLKNHKFGPNVTKIRLFSDGCGGQNKNSHMIHILMLWLHKYAPKSVQKIEYVFPVKGHSYLPADRVFGRVEKELRKHARIVFPEEYVKIYSKFGEVKQMGKDWSVYNLKSLLETFKKLDGISEQKRIYIARPAQKPGPNTVLVKTEITYRFNDPSKQFISLLKRGKKMESIQLEEVTGEQGISQDKGMAVNVLLKQAYGNQWYLEEQFDWYFTILRDFIINNDSREDTEYIDCECTEEEQEPRL